MLANLPLLLTLLGCSAEDLTSAEPPIPNVTVEAAREAPERFERTVSGVLEARQDATLSARAGGTVLERVVEPGDIVERGDPILRFDAREASAAVANAVAGVREAEALLEEANELFQRTEALQELASEQDRTGARTGLQRAEAALQRAEAQRDLAETQRSYLTVRAPFSGEVAMVEPQVGETVGPGTAVARVVDTGGLEITVGLLEDEVVAAREPGSRFEVVASGRTVPAELVHVSPAADPQTLTWLVRLATKPDAGLIAGQPATVRAGLASGGVGAQVPVQALRDADRVWVVEDQVVRDVTVSVLWESSATLVVSGLEPGDSVVTRGPSDLVEGMRVQVLGEGGD